MAGGQSLGPMLNLRLARPPVVIDISGLAELRTVTRQDGGLRVGAAVTHAEIEDGVHELLRGTPLQQVAPGIAYRAIRNRGTLGGSLAHADPAADWVLTMVGLGATLEIAGPDGVRMLPAQDYMQGAYTTGLREDELIAAVRIARGGAGGALGLLQVLPQDRRIRRGQLRRVVRCRVEDGEDRGGRVGRRARIAAPAGREHRAAGLAGLDPVLLADELAGVMPEQDEHHRKLHGTAVTRCLAQALG